MKEEVYGLRGQNDNADYGKQYLTENGYTPEFEAALLAEAEEMYAAVANGSAKRYSSAAVLRADMDAEND